MSCAGCVVLLFDLHFTCFCYSFNECLLAVLDLLQSIFAAQVELMHRDPF